MTAAADRDTRAATTRSRLVCAFGCLLGLIAVLPANGQTRPATAAATAPVEPYRPTLLAYGAADRYWIARVEAYPDGGKPRMRTLIRTQELPGGDWQEFDPVYGHAVALAESQGDLAILLEDGSWRRRGRTGLATGALIPGAGPVLAWASSARDLYAVRNVEGGVAGVATQPVTPIGGRPPSTSPATAATRPVAGAGPSISTRPAATSAATRPTRPARPTLLQLQQGEWVAVAELPPDAAAAPIALAVIGKKPALAVTTPAGALRTFAWADGRWQDFGQPQLSRRPGRFGLLAAGAHPALWTIDPDGVVKLFLKREGDNWAPASQFTLPAGLADNTQRILAFAGQDFRLVVLKDGELAERRYDVTGAPRADLVPLPPPQNNRPDALFWAIRGFVIVGMVIVMLLTFYHRRRGPDGARDDR
jgi:hypothetical protein